MKNHKSAAISAILFFVIIACLTFPVAAIYDSADEKYADASEVSEEEVNDVYAWLNYTENLPEVIKNAPYTYSLVMANESRKKYVLEAIQFMPIDDSEKENMSETIKDIWTRVPENVSESDYESLQIIGDSIIKYNMMGYATSSVSTQYSTQKTETSEEQRRRIQDEIDDFNIDGLTVDHVVELENRISDRKNLPEVVQNAPYRPILLANKKSQDGYLSHIDNMSISLSEKERMKADLKDLWNRSPNEITEDDYPRLTEIGTAIKEYVDETYFKKSVADKNDNLPSKWYGSSHGDFIYFACMKVLNNQTFANNAKSYADDPDEDGFDHCTFVFEYCGQIYTQN